MMTDADLGQLSETQAWYRHTGGAVSARNLSTISYVTSWDDESADIRREQERDARDDELARLHICDYPQDGSMLAAQSWMDAYCEQEQITVLEALARLNDCGAA